MSLPIEIQDYVMLFCEGHVRADLGIKTVAHARIERNSHESHTIFIEKKNTELSKGCVSKMVSETSVQYHWIKIVAF